MDRDLDDMLTFDHDMGDIQLEDIDNMHFRNRGRNGYESPQLTSDPSYTVNSSSVSYGILGRNKNRFTLMLEKFQTKNKNPPKREYFNAFIIRAIKRAFRNIISNKLPSTTCIKVNLKFPLQARYWNELGNLYRGNIKIVKELSSTESGPKTDGKKRGSNSRNMESERAHKSFNNQYCQGFFGISIAQQAFRIIVDLIFSEPSEDALGEKFKFYCCQNRPNNKNNNNGEPAIHDPGCLSKWFELKDYLGSFYFTDLDVSVAESVPDIESVFSFPE
jgi:hypothetical protein